MNKNKKFKPMLLSNDKFDVNALDYTNKFISKKRDGVRAEVTKEGINGRSLKVLRNKKMQTFFKEIYEQLSDGIILEAEIYADGIPCREMAGICNSSDKDIPENTKLYVFGVYNSELDFESRIKLLNDIITQNNFSSKLEIVKQLKIKSAKEATKKYDEFIAEGFEGAVLMDGAKKYKTGRVTIKQDIGYKMKPFKEDDLEIIQVNERFINTNESEINELGRSYKRNTLDAKQATGIAATFTCKLGDIETKVTITGDEESRKKIWENKEDYIGKYVVIKSMAYGVKDRLRHPTMIEIKEKCEK